ncbi:MULTISPECIES: GAF domain-containing protein [unclassified Leptolyngbya]|uniref:GAF domain-containing protein n=1 Tax=unclassified Leptolyngbya TaxID=2650499 RepID=UPI0016867F22|nr:MULTISPECIES: GAF domain-containing protein [unclassified Leptolyngbya]MBD1913046.1 GAF domain-containing protein [Leptolyngbya sp. FACHB-8]MBD2154453.1 GAF domain-containing protein [Leptolyngbya sp. FACHB-16]
MCLYGVRWGTLAGFIAGSCTYIIWHHPYTTLTFTLEALIVGWLFHHRHRNNIVLLDAAFWLVIGMPLVWLFYAVILQVDSTQALIILLKQPVNGIFNALIASLLLTHLPIHQWVARPPALRTLSLRQMLFNLLTLFVMVPTLALIILTSRQVVDDIKTAAWLDLQDASRYLTVEINTWYQRRLRVVQALSNLAQTSSLDSDILRQHGNFIHQVFPDLRHIHVLDVTGRRVFDVESATGQGENDFDEQAYWEISRRSPQPYISPVRLRPGAHDQRTVLIGLPIVQDGTLKGAVVGEIDLVGLTSLLKANVDNQALNFTLIDQNQKVAASTLLKWDPHQAFDWRKGGDIDPIREQTYQWFPNTGSPLVMVRWINSQFVQEVSMGHGLPWTLIVQMGATQHVHHIERVHTRNMAILLLVSSCAPFVSMVVSRQIVKPIAQLADVTTNLPYKLVEHEPIDWVQSQITEFSLLVQNFRTMAFSLQQKFSEIQQVNATLEQRVQERTQALQESNAALSESETRFRQMAENIREVFWMRSAHRTQLLYISPAYELIWGRTCESLYAEPHSFLGAVHPEDRERVANIFMDIQEEILGLEYRIVHPDGSIRWIWDRGFTVRNDVGEIYRIVGVAQDITERKQAEMIMRQQAERERLLGAIALQMRQSLQLDNILNTTVAEVRQFLQTDRVIVYQFQPDWSGVVAVESVAEGWQSILGRRITDAYFAETRGVAYKQGRIFATTDTETDNLADCHRELLIQLQVRATLVVPVLQGDVLWGLLVAQHCRAPRVWQMSEIDFLRQLAIQAAIAIHQSELYQHEQRLNLILEHQVEERTVQLQQALRYEAMITRMTDKVRDSLDEDQILQTAVEELGRGLEVNSCDTALFDLAQGTMTISHAYGHDASTPYPKVMSARKFSDISPQLLKRQSIQFCECPTVEANRHPRTVFACPIMDDQEVLGKLRLFRDSEAVFSESEIRVVSQVASQCAIAIRQARLYQAAQVEVKALEELNQLKDDFLSTVSHELRTPISNMKMAIHMLRMIPSEERRTRYMEILQTECAREVDLINDLLDLQRLASGTRILEPESIPLQEWLEELVEPFRERCRNRQQTLQVTLAPNLSTWTTDRSCLTRILAELLNNACKYTPPGESIDLSIKPLSLKATGEIKNTLGGRIPVVTAHLKITVRNTGVEIPAQELPRIFEKFYRIPDIDRWKQGGTGLGLALVQKLTEHIGGKIYAESHANATSFIIEI